MLGLSLMVLASAASAFAQAPVVLYNPLSKLPETSHTELDEQLVKERLVPRHKFRVNGDEACDGGSLEIIGAVDGSFTRTAAKQRVIVYELCRTGNGFANNGLAVIENGSVVTHYAEDGGWNLEVARVPDINKNGRDEIVIETGGGMHQGYTGSSITILEFADTGISDLGRFLVYTNECESYAPNKFCDRSYKLTAAPGAKPAFTSQKYLNRGTDEKPRWVLSGKPAAAKRIGELTNKYKVVI